MFAAACISKALYNWDRTCYIITVWYPFTVEYKKHLDVIQQHIWPITYQLIGCCSPNTLRFCSFELRISRFYHFKFRCKVPWGASRIHMLLCHQILCIWNGNKRCFKKTHTGSVLNMFFYILCFHIRCSFEGFFVG